MQRVGHAAHPRRGLDSATFIGDGTGVVLLSAALTPAARLSTLPVCCPARTHRQSVVIRWSWLSTGGGVIFPTTGWLGCRALEVDERISVRGRAASRSETLGTGRPPCPPPGDAIICCNLADAREGPAASKHATPRGPSRQDSRPTRPAAQHRTAP